MRFLIFSFFALSLGLSDYLFGQASILEQDSVKALVKSTEVSEKDKLELYKWLAIYSKNPLDQIFYGEKLLETASKYRSQEYIFHANMNLGISFRLIGKLETSFEYLFEAASICLSSEDLEKHLPDIYTEISTAYTQNGDTKNAMLYGTKSIHLLRKSQRKQELALTLLNHGYDFYLIGEYDSAQTYYTESEGLLREIDLEIGLAYLKGNSALLYWKQGDLNKAKNNLKESIVWLETFGDTFGMADFNNQLGTIYFEEGNSEIAIKYAMNGLRLSEKDEYQEQARDASKILADSYGKLGQYDKAYQFQAKYFAYRDSIQSHETTQRLANLRIEFEVGRKQAEVDRLLAQKENNRTIMLVGGLFLSVVIIMLVIIYSSFKSKNELSKKLNAQKSSLVEVNKTKDKFFSIISHDLRGPINALDGLVQIIRFYVNEGRTEPLKEVSQRMGEAVDKTVKLLDSLLTWSMQQQGQFKYLPETVSLKALLSEATEMFENSAISKKIALSYEIESDILIYVDRNTVSTILRNLINNSLKFTKAGGKVSSKASIDPTRECAVIEVSDNGIGISEERQERIFKLNESLSTRGTEGESGLGLGLQLVYEFVQLNKGRIEFSSTPGIGTTFKISLPLQT